MLDYSPQASASRSLGVSQRCVAAPGSSSHSTSLQRGDKNITRNVPSRFNGFSGKTVEMVGGPSTWLVNTSLKRGANEIGLHPLDLRLPRRCGLIASMAIL